MSKSDKTKLLRKYKNLSRVLTAQSNIEITFSGTQAYHIAGKINLPVGDFSDDDFITMSMGFCDHELGHENYTDNNWYQLASNKSSYLKDLLNALDDFHQERRLMNDFRGTTISLRKLVELCKVKGLFCVLQDDAPLPAYIQAWVLYKARSHLGQPLSDFFNETDKQVLLKFGQGFYDNIHSLLTPQVLDSLVTTEYCYETADKIFELLVEWLKDNQKKPDDSESDDSDSDDSDSDDSDSDDSDSDDSDSDDSDSDDSDSDDSNSDDSNSDDSNSDDSNSDDSNSDDSNSDDSNSDDSDSDDSDSDDSDSDDSDSDDSDSDDSSRQGGSNGSSSTSNQPTMQPSQEEIDSIIQKLDEYEDDFHQKLISEIESMAADHTEGNLISLPLSNEKIDTPLSANCLIDSNLRGVISKLKNPLKRLFHDQNFVNHSLHNRGKSINSGRLAGVAIGNTKVFESQTIHRSPNAAIALLIDKSGSMSDRDMRMANNVAYALSTALDGIHGVESLVAYYPERSSYEDKMAIVKGFEEKKPMESFNISSCGGTPTAEAIQSTTAILMSRAEPRKLLFVVTDGDPNSAGETVAAIEDAQALGIKVFGIGIHREVRGFSNTDFKVINSISELVNALTVGLKHAFK